MATISFMSANYVAQQLGYALPGGIGGWMAGDSATNDYFRALDTFGERFDALLVGIRSMGFTALDLWTAHLNGEWATNEHITTARDLLQRHDLTVVSLAGGFGATPEEFERSCRVAAGVGATILGGNSALLAQDRAGVVALLDTYDLKLGIENHPEKTPEELLEKIGDGAGGRIGAAVDTGWFGTQGYDAAQALARLGEHVVHVHLKDVLAVGGHQTCRFGRGVVPIQACVETLRRSGYMGAYSIEHEPEDFDPSDDCRAMLPMLQQMLDAAEARPEGR